MFYSTQKNFCGNNRFTSCKNINVEILHDDIGSYYDGKLNIKCDIYKMDVEHLELNHFYYLRVDENEKCFTQKFSIFNTNVGYLYLMMLFLAMIGLKLVIINFPVYEIVE